VRGFRAGSRKLRVSGSPSVVPRVSGGRRGNWAGFSGPRKAAERRGDGHVFSAPRARPSAVGSRLGLLALARESGEGRRRRDDTAVTNPITRDSAFAAALVSHMLPNSVFWEAGHRSIQTKYLKSLARPERFELPTPRFVVWCSIQLSYGRVDPLKGHDSKP
jgi:hypothetical protein